MSDNKSVQNVAIITGGASGMGLAVTQSLASWENWTVNIIDVNPNRLDEVGKSFANVVPHQADITNYDELAKVFHKVFHSSSEPRIDFVFANAGVIESVDFYKFQHTDPPPPPNFASVDVDLKGLISTCYLAQHYFRRSVHKGNGASLVLTASCASLYPSPYSPMYTGAKHGVLGFGRAIANQFNLEGIRVNIICPGLVNTNLTGENGFSGFPQDVFTPVERISETVLQLVDAQVALVDSKGRQVEVGKLYGLAIEINQDKVYIRDIPEFCDDAMRLLMDATEPGKQKGGVIKDYD